MIMREKLLWKLLPVARKQNLADLYNYIIDFQGVSKIRRPFSIPTLGNLEKYFSEAPGTSNSFRIVTSLPCYYVAREDFSRLGESHITAPPSRSWILVYFAWQCQQHVEAHTRFSAWRRRIRPVYHARTIWILNIIFISSSTIYTSLHIIRTGGRRRRQNGPGLLEITTSRDARNASLWRLPSRTCDKECIYKFRKGISWEV